jgi:tetratricopeptide (TPR) repeat protein
MAGISGTQTLLASTPYPSLEAQRKDLEERKLILIDKRMDLGDNHPETLDAMESLACLHYELGEFSSAGDLRVKVLETYQILHGEDDPRTLQAMIPLGITQLALGQYKEAQEMLELPLEKQRKVLGENHPETAGTLSFVASMYQDLGQ